MTGSGNFFSHWGQAYFSATGAGDCSSMRRAVRASAIAGRNSRVRVAMVSSTLTSRPFTFLAPNRLGKFCRMSWRIMGFVSPEIRWYGSGPRTRAMRNAML